MMAHRIALKYHRSLEAKIVLYIKKSVICTQAWTLDTTYFLHCNIMPTALREKKHGPVYRASHRI